MPEAVITVAGTRFAGWTALTVTRSIERMSGTFELRLTEREPTERVVPPIVPGAACAVALDDETAITGHIDDVEPSYDARRHEVAIRGRDAVGDMIDCSAVHEPGQWRDIGLLDLATILAQPFGVKVSADVDTGERFRTFGLQESETAFEALGRACGMRGVLPVSDSLGGLTLTRAGRIRSGARLKRGDNILEARGLYSFKDRFSSYTVKAQQPGDDSWDAEASAEPHAMVDDPAIGRHRPLVLLAGSPADSAACAERAQWERRVRAGRAKRADITVQGWGHGGGLWRPNRLVSVDDDWLGLTGEVLIVSVTFLLDDEGSRTELSLAPAGAFERRTEEEGEDEGDFGW